MLRDINPNQNILVTERRKRKRNSVPDIQDDEQHTQSTAKDNRSFEDFMQEVKPVEVVRKYKVYPNRTPVKVKENGELWIGGEQSDVVISAATISIMKEKHLWDKKLFIGKQGYVVVGSSHAEVLHTIIPLAKKDSDFRNLLELGAVVKKANLQVLHLNDKPYDFNLENLQYGSHDLNMLMKMSYGSPAGKKFNCSVKINYKDERTASFDTRLEARHACDILKINNVPIFHRDFIFNHGLNFKYPSLDSLLNRTHLYKSKPSHKGKPFKSQGSVSLLDFAKDASPGLKKAVTDSKIPFDTTEDVLVHYKGKDKSFHFLMELEDYNKYAKDKQVSFKKWDGYIKIVSDYPEIGLHRLVLGLVKGDSKVGRHRVDGEFGKLDNRKRVLRKGNHASNMGDISKKTANSTSSKDGVYWDSNAGKYRARMMFSNQYVRFKAHLGLFGAKGDRTKGELEASTFRDKVKANQERILEQFEDIQVLDDFKRLVNEEIDKLK